MKTLKKGLLLLFAAMFCIAGASAQKKSIAQKADDLFDQYRFYEAAEQYQKAYEKIKDNKAEKNRVYFQLAECYRLMYEYDKARRIYERLANDGYQQSEPMLYFYLAEMYRFLAESHNYKQYLSKSDEFYEKYMEVKPGDSYAAKRKASLIYASQLADARTRHEITKMEDWCSDYNDWAPRFYGNDTTKIVFTTSRYAEGDDSDKDPWTNQAYSDFYTVFQDRNGNWNSLPEPWDKTGRINTEVNEGEACFSPDGNTIYFSRFDVVDNETSHGRIYMATRKPEELEKKKGKKQSTSNKGKKKKHSNLTPWGMAQNIAEGAAAAAAENAEVKPGEWNEPTVIYLGDTAYNYLYPAISSDGLTLYFSSDMPGGFGDYDLWKATRKSLADDFGRPVNLTSIVNTRGKEVFPVLRNDSLMYFSSDGHPGVGGYDLFKSSLRPNGKWTTPENLGIPINSSHDEMSIIFYPDSLNATNVMERGYFSSNRPFADLHNRQLANQSKNQTPPINNDIFYFTLPGLNYAIEGTVRSEKSMQLLEGVRIRMVGSDGSEYETRTNKKGFYRFDSTQVRRDVVYKMYLSKKDYFSIEGSESTKGYNTNKTLVHDYRMDPVPARPVVLPEIRFDLARTELKGEFMDSLMDLYIVMDNNPGLVVEIRSHTDCQPYIGLTNDTLSQRRAQTVVDYLVDRGIERERLVAKGYADRVPRVLDEDVVVTYNGKQYPFYAGTEMTCDYIATLDPDRQQAAHSLNRRLEFLVLRNDYVSRRMVENMASDTPVAKQTEDGKVIDLVNRPVNDEATDEVKPTIVHDESVVPVTMVNSTRGEVACIVNGSQVPMLIDERFVEPVAISWEEAMNFLYQGRITKDDFPRRDLSFDAEGNIIDKEIIIFKEMQIGEQRKQNVEVVVVKNVDYKFIINRNGLRQFGDYEFDKQRSKLIFFDE
ncbi:MAG: PD40 domain-containing protein [Bacteroidales bacterium]|nr:PD40 domain-containing protein [Bacteroidales bacterium]